MKKVSNNKCKIVCICIYTNIMFLKEHVYIYIYALLKTLFKELKHSPCKILKLEITSVLIGHNK
jgi:hypothetical protein